MSLKRIINYILIFVLAIFTLGLSVEAAEEGYYVVGSFNSYKMDEKSKMTLNEDGSYSYLLDNSANDIQLSITDGENYYRTGGLNKGSSFLIKEKGLYDITLDTTKENNNVSIVKRPEPSYYVLGSVGYEINDSLKMSYIDRGKYEYILDCEADTLIYISDGTKEYRDINGDDYYIREKGKYKLSLTISSTSHLLRITAINEPEYYVISSLNGYLIDEAYKMSLEEDEYVYDINTTGYVGFYIGNEDESYKNGLVEYTLAGMKSYRLHFKPATSEVIIEEVGYYILNEENGFQIDEKYKLDLTDNTSFLEYSYLLDTSKPYQFLIASKYNIYDDNGASFIIDKDGRMEILFSPSQLYSNDRHVAIRTVKKPSNKYYLVGSFNSYEINEDYLLEYNVDNLDYTEFTIELSLNKGDSFYIKNENNSYYAPNGEELIIPYNGDYRIYFSRDYDYGNGYNIAYKLIRSEESEPKTIIIENKADLLDFISKANVDSFSSNLTVELKCDINMGGEEISPISVFGGIFNGNYHKIYNFSLASGITGGELGFINLLLETGEVNSLVLDYSLELKGDTTLGGIAGRSYGVIRNSSYTGRLKGEGATGGIVGRLEDNGKIIGSSVYGDIISRAFAGGICGISSGEIIEATSYARINNTIFSSADENKLSNIGGIVGYNSGSIVKSANKGSVGAKRVGIFVGGIAGSSIGSISECYNTANIAGKSYIGGICGYFSEITKSNSISPDYDDIIKEIEDILNNNNSSTTAYKGNKINGSITFSYNAGGIYAGDRAGGIVGLQANDAINKEYKLENNYNKGTIEAGSYAGGISGESLNASIYSSFNIGIITAADSYAGGISGSSLGLIEGSFNNASIKANSHAGGICGYGAGINNCYSIALIYAKDSYGGGISGEVKDINSSIANNYYISNEYKAFSNVDYAGKGMEVTRDSLASMGSLKLPLDFKYFEAGDKERAYPRLRGMSSYDGYLEEQFSLDLAKATAYTVNLTFVDADGNIVRIDRVEYNSDYNLANLPEVPKRDGYLVKWDPAFTGIAICEDTIIKAVYVELITSIKTKPDSAILGILEGELYPDTSLELISTDNNYLGSDTSFKMLGSYKIKLNSLENSVNMDNLVMNIKANSNKSTRIAIVKDGSLIFVPFEVNGEYLRFNLNGATEFMVLEEVFYNINNPDFLRAVSYGSLGVVIGLIVIAGGISIISNKRRRAL